MSHSYTKLFVHAVWATKRRAKVIAPEIQPRLFAYISGVASNIGRRLWWLAALRTMFMCCFHCPANLQVSKAVATIKANSGRWLNDTYPEIEFGQWQEGYAAFSIGIAGVARTEHYIRNQAEHHKLESYQAELRRFLLRHGIEEIEPS
jgi:REP element-mobilizing transposase RayT